MQEFHNCNLTGDREATEKMVNLPVISFRRLMGKIWTVLSKKKKITYWWSCWAYKHEYMPALIYMEQSAQDSLSK